MNKTYSPEELHFHAGVIYINGAGHTLRGGSPDGHWNNGAWYERVDGLDLHQLLLCKKPESSTIRRHVLKCCSILPTKMITLQDVLEIAAFVSGLDVSQVDARCWSINQSDHRWHVEITSTDGKKTLANTSGVAEDFPDVQSCLEFLYLQFAAKVKQKQEEIRKFLAACPAGNRISEPNE